MRPWPGNASGHDGASWHAALAEIDERPRMYPAMRARNALLKKLSAGRTILRVAGFVVAGLVLAQPRGWPGTHPGESRCRWSLFCPPVASEL